MDAISALHSLPCQERVAWKAAAIGVIARIPSRYWHYLLLAVLPLLLLAVDRSWLASALFLDPYIYLGYYFDLPGHLRALPDNYISTRLPALLLGWLAHSVLPVLVANAVLHMGLFYVSIFCLYRTLTILTGARAALLAAILLGGNSFFQAAVGADYTDGYAIAFISISLALLQAAALGERPVLRLVGAGAALAALVHTNVFFILFAGLVGMFFLDANRRGNGHPLLASTGWLLLGAGLLTGFLMLVNYYLCGRLWFFLANAAASVDLARHHTAFRHQGWSWLLDAAWLVGPAGSAVGGGACLWLRRRERASAGLCVVILLALALGVLLALERSHIGVVRFWYYATPLIPLVALVVGTQVSHRCEAMSGRRFCGVVTIAMLSGLAIASVPGQQTAWAVHKLGPFLLPVALGVLAFLWLARIRANALALAGFVVLLSLSTAWAKAGFRYESPWPEVPGEIYDRIREHDRERFDVLQAVAETVRLVKTCDRPARVRFWYSYAEPLGLVFREVACTNFFARVNEEFPATTGLPLPAAGSGDAAPLIVILSQNPDALGQAQAALARLGFTAKPRLERRIHHRRIAFTMTVLELQESTPEAR